MHCRKNTSVHFCVLEDSADLNHALLEAVARYADDPAVRRTHFFGGRYENLYIGTDRVPELARVFAMAVDRARDILSVDMPLRAGGWFNCMGPGHVTLPHRHDDDDELLSAVYYVQVPADSGELVISEPPFHTRIEPRTGMFVFFPPDALHEVTANQSGQNRISIGINIGPAHE